MEPNKQYRVDTEINQRVKSRLWNQNDSREDTGCKQAVESRHPNQIGGKEQTMEPNRQYRVDAGIKETVKSSLWNPNAVQSRQSNKQ